MRKLMMQVGMTGLLAVALVAPATAGNLYKWTGPDGDVSYTDDLKRVPQQYRAGAAQIKTKSLKTYERYTPQAVPGKNEQRERLQARLERLRAFNQEPRGTVRMGVPHSQTVLRMNDRMSLAIPNDQITSSEPVIVEELRVRNPDTITTRHLTVVKQGDRVISVIRPKATHNGAGWQDEADLLGDRD
jgi:hypothetical protein